MSNEQCVREVKKVGHSWVEGNVPNMVDPSGKSAALANRMNSVCYHKGKTVTAFLTPFNWATPSSGLFR